MKYTLFVMLFFSTITVSAQSLTPVANPVILDSTGKFMGHVFGYAGRVYLLFKFGTNDHIVLALTAVPGSGLTWDATSYLFYQSNDCTGQAYASDPGIGERYATIGPNNVLFVSALNASPQSVAWGSLRFGNGPCTVGTATSNLVAVNPGVSLDTLFQGPFRASDLAQQSVPALGPRLLVVLAVVLAGLGVVVMRR